MTMKDNLFIFLFEINENLKFKDLLNLICIEKEKKKVFFSSLNYHLLIQINGKTLPPFI